MTDRDFEENILGNIQENFLKDGKIVPLLLGTIGDKVAIFPLRDVKNRGELAMLIRQMRLGLDQVVFVSGELMKDCIVASFFFRLRKFSKKSRVEKLLGCSDYLSEWEEMELTGDLELLLKNPVEWN